jgi:hypothetical protein
MKITEWNQRHVENFPVGEGWRPLVEKLVCDICAIDTSVTVSQVKEKFGGLRFYIYAGSPEVWKLIEKAERASYTICEECGAPSKCRSKAKYGWIYNRCGQCWKKMNEQFLNTDI